LFDGISVECDVVLIAIEFELKSTVSWAGKVGIEAAIPPEPKRE